MPMQIGMTEEQYIQARLERLYKKPDTVHYVTTTFKNLHWNVECCQMMANLAIEKIADVCKSENVSEESFRGDGFSCSVAAHSLQHFCYALFKSVMALIDSVDEPLTQENWITNWADSYQSDGCKFDGDQKNVAIMRVGVDVDKLSLAQRQNLKTLLDTKAEVLNRKSVEEEAQPGAIFDAILMALGVAYDYDSHKLTTRKATDADFRSFAAKHNADEAFSMENATALINAWAAKAHQDIKMIAEATPADAIITDATE